MNQLKFLKEQRKAQPLIRAPEKKDIVLALITFVCQRASILGFNPFGCVMFAATAKKDFAYLYITAILTGALTSGSQVIKYFIASLIIWTIKIFMSEKEKNKLFSIFITSSSIFVSGLLLLVIKGTHILGFSTLLLEVIISAVSFSIFSNLNLLIKQQEKNEPTSKENALCFVVTLMISLWGLSGINLPYSIGIKTIISIYMILCLTMYSNFSVSATFAMICGFIGSATSPQALACSGILGISAIFSSILKTFGQLGSSVGFMTGVTFSILFAGSYQVLPISVADILIATLLFAIIPPKFNQYTGIFLANTFKFDTARRDFRIKEYISEELNSFSHTFSEFARQFKSSFQKGTENISSPASLFDETASRICADCNRFGDCWQKNFNDTYKYMFSILNTTDIEGYCTVENAPIVFIQKCIQPDMFLKEFNHVYEMHKLDILQKGMRFGERKLVSNQYVEISKVISELSEEIQGNFYFDEYKEKIILSECSKQAIYLKDLNVVRDCEGYYEMYFSLCQESDIDKITQIASDVLGMRMKRVYCKNKSINKLSCDDVFDIDIAYFQKEKDSEPVCGDTVVHFKTDKGKYYVILCDGMGSGCDASRESRITADLLSGFLKAGFSKNIAINLINSTLALKMDREGFSTIDLCEIDLRSGKAEFIKIGGAQSYIKTENNIETISSKGMPAGIMESITADNIKKELYDNDMIVMVSDGVSEAGYGLMRGEWVKSLMNGDCADNEELAKNIVTNARKKIYPRIPDDMSAVVITLHKIDFNEEEIIA